MPSDSSVTELPLLAVAMIVRNAEHLLVDTLESIRSTADMIVVMDTGSTDGTLEVARRFTPNVVSHKWSDDFAAARNECLSRVRTQWVLWLDAGECLDQKEVSALRRFLENEADKSKAYMLLVRVAKAPGAIAAEQVGRIRLIPNRPGLQFAGRVREDISGSLDANQIAVEGLPWCIHRSVEHHDKTVMISKASRDAALADLELSEHETRSSVLNCLGEALQTLDEKKRAADCFRHAIRNAPNGSTAMLEAYYGLLTSLDGEQQAAESQLAVCLEAVEIFPLDMQLLCAMGGYLQATDRLDLAARAYETAYRFGQTNPDTWHLENIRDIAAVCFSLAVQMEGDDEKALSILDEAVAETTGSIRLRKAVIDLLIKMGRREDALRHAVQLPAEFPFRDTYAAVIDGACLATTQDWSAALSPLQEAYAAGCRDNLCLRWLTAALVAQQDLTQADKVLREWKNLEPDSIEVKNYYELIQSYQVQAEAKVAAHATVSPAATPTNPPSTIVSPIGSIPTPPPDARHQSVSTRPFQRPSPPDSSPKRQPTV